MPAQVTNTKYGQNGVMEVFDPNFKNLYVVPTACVLHVPPARLNISRLVICRNYVAHVPDSCPKQDNCRFVHADVDYSTLEVHPIHVNYIWRHESHCTYERLPPGDVLKVYSQDDFNEPELIPSELVLSTRMSVDHHKMAAHPLIHCPLYSANRMCNRGDRCSFIHTVCVDPNVVGNFKRAPTRSPASSSGSKEAVRTLAGDGSSESIDIGAAHTGKNTPAPCAAGEYTAASFRVPAVKEPVAMPSAVSVECRVTARVRAKTGTKSWPTLAAAFRDGAAIGRAAKSGKLRAVSYCHNPYHPILRAP